MPESFQEQGFFRQLQNNIKLVSGSFLLMMAEIDRGGYEVASFAPLETDDRETQALVGAALGYLIATGAVTLKAREENTNATKDN